jgi:predicted transcriptional regulator
MGLGYVMLGFGVYAFLSGGPGGLWIALIGWFAASSARAALQDDAVRSRLATRTAAELLPASPMSVDTGAPLDVAADTAFLRGGERAVLVREAERVVGVLTVEAVRAVPEPRRPFLTVADAMTAIDDQPVVEAQTPASDVLERVQEGQTAYVLVRRDGEPIGIVSVGSLAGWVGRSAELGTTGGRR